MVLEIAISFPIKCFLNSKNDSVLRFSFKFLMGISS